MEDNPNVPHPDLEERIRQTYAARSKAQLRRALNDLYKMSIRWATDRIGERGIVAFVTPNGYLDGNAESGMRACLVDEFTTIYVFNLRGNARLQGEARRREKGNVFGSSTRVGVAVTVMVRNPDTTHDGCRIHYRDIGDYLTLEQKLQALVDLGVNRRDRRMADHRTRRTSRLDQPERPNLAESDPARPQRGQSRTSRTPLTLRSRLYSALELRRTAIPTCTHSTANPWPNEQGT